MVRGREGSKSSLVAGVGVSLTVEGDALGVEVGGER